MTSSSSIRIFSFTGLLIFLFLLSCGTAKKVSRQSAYNEPHRPQIHFSPPSGWMNDPNGLVYHNGTYHLMYQFYPDSTVWGPMHWGYATSRDLIHWDHQPTALYPDSLGWIFSGSAVADVNNTSGFGRAGQVPLVAVFTHHSDPLVKKGVDTFQYQSLAYSLDEGRTWTKYSGNPVLRNPGIRDFRDPKILWYEKEKKWIMTLATLDRITFYSSPDLKSWTRLSEFGKDRGARGGVWECPDLFPLVHNGKEVWLLIVNLNPGGPNGGSATQYFVGDFDGRTFTANHTDTRWLDYGPDEYAGITWSGLGDRRVFHGWMSNWLYGQQVPTDKWRSALTIPRDLSLRSVGNEVHVASRPSPELAALQLEPTTLQNISLSQPVDLGTQLPARTLPARLDLRMDALKDFALVLSNAAGEEVVIGYDADSNHYYIDRRLAGKTDFHKEFAARPSAPRISRAAGMDMTLVLDVASVELFADEGLSVLTGIFFPTQPFDRMQLRSKDGAVVNRLTYAGYRSIWK